MVIAAITSCTNTSNPIGNGRRRPARAQGAGAGAAGKPWVKTSLAPGSQVVTDYLEKAGLQDDLDALGFNVVGYGCTTCIGNSGPLPAADRQGGGRPATMTVCSVLSGNRNFEGRVNPHVRANYLASPPLVVAYALAGTTEARPDHRSRWARAPMATTCLSQGHLAEQPGGRRTVADCLTPAMFQERYANVFEGRPR